MIIYNDKQYRNLEEQVLKNQQDIANLMEENNLAELGIKIISAEPLPDVSYLPEDYTGDYGDAYLVGTVAPYELYIWTRGQKWFDFGPLNAPSVIPGPEGPQGPQGQDGTPGSKWYVGSGAPVIGAQYNVNDMYLDSATGYVYQLTTTGNWQNKGSIQGPQGIVGPQGIQGVQGIQGIQGPQGIQGEPGKSFSIGGILQTTDQLPTPTEELQPVAYLVGTAADYNLYVIVGQDSTYEWVNLGKVAAIEGPQGPQGEPGATGATGATGQQGHPIYYSTQAPDSSMQILTQYITPSSPAIQTTDFVITANGDLYRVVTTGSNYVGVTYINSLIGPAGLSPTGTTITPATAKQGTLTTDQLSILQENDFNYIILNNEIYSLQDKSHEEGYLVYSHVGMDTTKNTFIKTITITLSTRGWVLTSTQIPSVKYMHRIVIGQTGNDKKGKVFIQIVDDSSEVYTARRIVLLLENNDFSSDSNMYPATGWATDYQGVDQPVYGILLPLGSTMYAYTPYTIISLASQYATTVVDTVTEI